MHLLTSVPLDEKSNYYYSGIYWTIFMATDIVQSVFLTDFKLRYITQLLQAVV